jgi:hypothetical protein
MGPVLLQGAVVELKMRIVEHASDHTIGRTLKKTLSNCTCKNHWVIPLCASAVEDVLEVCHRPHGLT